VEGIYWKQNEKSFFFFYSIKKNEKSFSILSFHELIILWTWVSHSFSLNYDLERYSYLVSDTSQVMLYTVEWNYWNQNKKIFSRIDHSLNLSSHYSTRKLLDIIVKLFYLVSYVRLWSLIFFEQFYFLMYLFFTIKFFHPYSFV